MKRRFFYQPLTVGILVLALCLLVAVLLSSARATWRDVSPTLSPRSVAGVSGILFPRSTAAYNGVITPATTLYAPWLLGRTSALRVHNAGGSAATVRATFTHSGGATTSVKVLPAGAVGEIRPSGVQTGTQLSAILTATQPIVAVVNDFGLVWGQAASYAAMPGSLGQTYLALPDIRYGSAGGWYSTPVIQNVGDMSTSVTIVYTRTTEPPATTYWIDDSLHDLAPGEVHVFDPGRAGVPDDFTGIATIQAGQPLIAVVHNATTEVGELYPTRVYVYRVPLPLAGSGSGSLYAPLLVKAFESWSLSWIQLMNASSSTADFTLEIGAVSSSESIPPWRASSFDPEDQSQAQDWVGAGRVTDGQSLHGLVWLRGGFAGDFLAAYSTFSVGARTWYLPYVDQGNDFTTYVAVQNLSDVSSAQITLTYHDLSGALSPVSGGSIERSGMRLYSAVPGFVGGVVVEADKPVVAVAVISGQVLLDEEVYLPIVTRNR
jgi:hypothetical protein